MDFDHTSSTPFETWGESQEVPVAAASSPRSRRSPAKQRVPKPARSFTEEAYLIERLQARDEDAYAYLMETQRERMASVARRYFSEEEDVRDAVQEGFIAVFRAIHRFEGKAALSTWLHRVVVNACLMKLRTRRRKPEQSFTPAISESLVSPAARGAQTELEGHEVSARIHEAIEALPEPHRSVIRLRDLEERNTSETARELVISQAAVKTRLHRARNLLRAQLSESSEDFAQSA